MTWRGRQGSVVRSGSSASSINAWTGSAQQKASKRPRAAATQELKVPNIARVPRMLNYEMLTALGSLIVFLVMAALMATNRVSALLALPAMALAIAVVAGIPGPDILHVVIQDGATKLGGAIITTMVGAVLAQAMTRFGIGARLVRWAAEFSGDDPFVLGLGLMLVTAVLFSSMGGLGAVIMVGSVVLPVLMSVGLPATTSAGILLLGISLGGMFNLANWKLFIEVLKVPQAEIERFVLPFGLAFALVAASFILFEVVSQAGGAARRRALMYFKVGGPSLAAIGALIWGVHAFAPGFKPEFGPIHSNALYYGGQVALAIFLVGCWVHRRVDATSDVPAYALLAPILPLFLVLAYKIDMIPAFVLGISHAVLCTWRRGWLNAATQAIFEGISAVVPVLVLMMGIGMVLQAMMHPVVSAAVKPYLQGIVPSTPLPYVVVFGLLAPMSLYRGPLNLFGLGSGLAGLILGTGLLKPPAVMGMLQSVGQVQGVCDPTNTANIWVANFVGSSPTRLMFKTLPWAWTAAILGLILAASRYF